MSFQGLMLIKNIDNIEFVMKFSSIALGQATHLLLNCIPGQKLMDHSANVFYSIYEINWYEMPITVQKMLLLMMRRSLKETKITVGTLVVFSIETYSSLMKMTFSYLSVLNSMK
ncbi:putative odorant receptor 19b [Leptopilina heterotoma]|uniref:putative odorant receptor 19b n=1 Tax=Leptopilina heterotoma TaxID=63436 RepID=UPI001CA9CEB4|nr:putative odorant receptor 19b [Leptopilina heterotoma]